MKILKKNLGGGSGLEGGGEVFDNLNKKNIFFFGPKFGGGGGARVDVNREVKFL